MFLCISINIYVIAIVIVIVRVLYILINSTCGFRKNQALTRAEHKSVN